MFFVTGGGAPVADAVGLVVGAGRHGASRAKIGRNRHPTIGYELDDEARIDFLTCRPAHFFESAPMLSHSFLSSRRRCSVTLFFRVGADARLVPMAAMP